MLSRLRTMLRRSGSIAALTAALGAAVAAANGGPSSITPQALREWLGYVASDELQGRAVFSEGFGLAGGYGVDAPGASGASGRPAIRVNTCKPPACSASRRRRIRR